MSARMTEAEFAAYERKLAQWRSGNAPKPPTKKGGPFPYEPLAQHRDGSVSVVLPIRLVNGSNERSHWSTRRKRAEAHRDITAQALPRHKLPKLPVVVTITRYGRQLLDEGDNLNISCKHVRDSIAERYGVNDNTPQIEWRYAQERGEYAAKVEIRAK